LSLVGLHHALLEGDLVCQKPSRMVILCSDSMLFSNSFIDIFKKLAAQGFQRCIDFKRNPFGLYSNTGF